MPRPNAVGPRDIRVSAAYQEVDGPWRRARGHVEIETTEMLLRADQIDYNEVTAMAEARGNVKYTSFTDGTELEAERAEYNLRDESGKFWSPKGSTPAKIDARPGVLTSSNPFLFQGKWAERIKDRYILYDGFITSCRLPKPWWVLRGPRFDIIPEQRALAYSPIFWLKGVPLFYTPVFYKPLAKQPRRSGFLTPSLGNSSRRGKMVGLGYYWAINRSYDVQYRSQYFTQRGFAHHVDMRGKPRQGSDFNFILYGVNDRGLLLPNGERRKEGGYLISFTGKAELGRGFEAFGVANYLSSFLFRQSFTESFNEAIFSEVNSVGFVTKHWSSFGVNVVAARSENYQSARPDDKIVIRHLPQVEFTSRDRRPWKNVPVWVSLDSSAGLVRRNQPLFQTRQFVERFDAAPRVMTALRWKEFQLIPSFAARGTYYGSSQQDGRVAGQNVVRTAREFGLDLRLPALERIYERPGWMGERFKHVIEPRAGFRYVSGVTDFQRIIRFDETELLTNTKEAEISITNRIYTKSGGVTRELLSWEVWQRRYFDPDFGGVIVAGERNVVASSADLTAFAFLDRPRHYSPVISTMRVMPQPGFGIEWRSDYDPLRKGVVNSSFSADARLSNYFFSLGHTHVRSERLLSPSANQFRGLVGLGAENRRGWNAAFMSIYDYRLGTMQFANTQVTYNSDCCGFSVQYRRFSFGTRNENQFRIAFSVANIGSFGTLRRQERFF